jgi:hypothetical protein
MDIFLNVKTIILFHYKTNRVEKGQQHLTVRIRMTIIFNLKETVSTTLPIVNLAGSKINLNLTCDLSVVKIQYLEISRAFCYLRTVTILLAFEVKTREVLA